MLAAAVVDAFASNCSFTVLGCQCILCLFAFMTDEHYKAAFICFQLLHVLIVAGRRMDTAYCWPDDDALHIGVLCHSGHKHVFALIVSDGDAYYRAVVLIAVVYVTVTVFGLVELAVSVDERQRAVEQVFFGDRLP